jgi:propionyl-CoA carboxylase alpha chain
VKREGLASFGDDRVFIEKFIESPRHIEIQLLGDKHGNILYLNERECSVQRRHQKVVEEAPSPFVTPAMRKAMGEQAVALARAVGYTFGGHGRADRVGRRHDRPGLLLPRDEHPPAGGASRHRIYHRARSGRADDPRRLWREAGLHAGRRGINGWAVENRVYAEDPYRGFLPSTGRLVRYRPPAPGPACPGRGKGLSRRYEWAACRNRQPTPKPSRNGRGVGYVDDRGSETSRCSTIR